ncbi:MAG: type II toxin-antitoxin system HicB family antitoxin [Patescibacteria group bacterium]
MNPYTFRTIIEPDDPSGYHGFVPLLSGVHTHGDTIEDVRQNLKEAIICHIQGLVKDGETVPREEEVLETVQTISERELALA